MISKTISKRKRANSSPNFGVVETKAVEQEDFEQEKKRFQKTMKIMGLCASVVFVNLFEH
jgi:hypothetical protein